MTRAYSSPQGRRRLHEPRLAAAEQPLERLVAAMAWLRSEAALLDDGQVARLASRAERLARRLNGLGLRRRSGKPRGGRSKS